MIIKRVEVRRLRAIRRERSVDFSPGLNIVKGSDNEAGKSSLRIAITKGMFQDPATVSRDVQALTSWGTDEPWEVTLDFEADGKSYRISRSLKERSSELSGTGGYEFTATNRNTIAERMAEITGCPSEVFFESTACIGQDELIRVVPAGASPKEEQQAKGLIAQRLQSKLSGTEGADVSAILARLYGKIHRKDAGGPHCHLVDILDRVAHLRNQRLAQEDKVNRIVESRRELNRVKEELSVISRDLPAKQEILGKNRRILELQKEIARGKTQYDAFRRASDLKSKLDDLDGELRRFSGFTGHDAEISGLSDIKGRLAELDRQKTGLDADMKALRQQKPAPWMLAAGLVLMAGGLVGLLATSPYLWAAAVAGSLLAVYWSFSWVTWRKQVESLSRRVRDAEGQFQAGSEAARRLLEALGFRDASEYERQLAEYTGRMEARKEVAIKLDAVLPGGDWQGFAAENADLDIQMSTALKELEQAQPFRLEPLALQQLELEVKAFQERREKLQNDRSALERFLDLTDRDTDQMADIEEELEGLEREKEFWERRRRVFQVTREALEEAHKQTLSRAADLLEKELRRYVAIVTDGRYSQVKIDDTDLSLRTLSPEKNDWVDVRNLSRATQDQFYICARFALVKLITQGKRPPMLLDDPFVNFHPRRLKKTMVLLQELAREYQILLFTCSDAYDYLGNVITLE